MSQCIYDLLTSENLSTSIHVCDVIVLFLQHQSASHFRDVIDRRTNPTLHNRDVRAERSQLDTALGHDVRTSGTSSHQTPLSLQEENLVRAVHRSTEVLLGPDGVRVIFMLDHMLGPANTRWPDPRTPAAGQVRSQRKKEDWTQVMLI